MSAKIEPSSGPGSPRTAFSESNTTLTYQPPPKKFEWLPWIKRGLALLVVVGIVFGVRAWQSRPVTVDTVNPSYQTVVESVAISGRVRGVIESDIGSQVGGRVDVILVREGARVTAGQPVARLDDRLLREQEEQSLGGIRTAQAQLLLAARKPLESEFARLRADTEQNIRVARAKLRGAEDRLAELTNGSRKEDLNMAEAQLQQINDQTAMMQVQVAQGQVQLEQAKKDYDRVKSLFSEGAVSQSELDKSSTALQLAAKAIESAQRQVTANRSAADNARAKLELLRNGTRTEQLAQARSEVEAARATLAGVERSGQEQMSTLRSQPRPEDVSVATARLDEAKRSLDVARQRIRDSVVLAPYDGTITRVLIESGAITGPNQPIFRLVRTRKLEIRVDVDENYLDRVAVGKTAVVSNDAFKDVRFDAVIREIGAQVDADRGTVEVRLDPRNPPAWLRPGQTVSVNILLDPGSRKLTLPLTAVKSVGEKSIVLLVRDGKTVEQVVKVGPAGAKGVPILSGLTEADKVVVGPASVTAGASVALRSPTTEGKR